MAQSGEVLDLQEARNRADNELRDLAQERRKKLREARFAQQMGQLSKTHTLRQMRRDIARIETILAGRQQNNEVK